MEKKFITLGIETSCDETSTAILEGAANIRSSVVSSQVDIHALFGGVVPEIAARKHLEVITPAIEKACIDAGISGKEVDLVAVTVGPGLAVSLVVGIAAARAFSGITGAKIIGVNHLEGHILANLIESPSSVLPAIALLVSGGHTDIILVKDIGKYERLGGTLDDAAGEAFDKIARLLDLGYPGGPAIQNAAEQGEASSVRFPRPMMNEPGFDMSFSGLKTAVINTVRKLEGKGISPVVADIAASFQEAVIDVLCEKTLRAAKESGVRSVFLCGGVAANRPLREEMRRRVRDCGFDFFTPKFEYCTDNAAMVAKAGYENFTREVSKYPLSPMPGLGI